MNPKPSNRLAPFLAFCVLTLGGVGFARAQSNIVFNGSFELLDADWSFSTSLGIHPNQGAAEGTNHVSVQHGLWQDLNTVPGRDYVLTFALLRPSPYPLQVSWGDVVLTGFTNLNRSGILWQYVYCYVVAVSNVTRLRFDASGFWGTPLDDVRVGWLYEPLRIVAQPQSRTGFEGGSAAFSVTADGAPPLSYEWWFNGEPIPGASARVLSLTELRPWQAGQYSVVVSNVTGTVLSDLVQLEVEPPATSPVIINQPAGDVFPAGYGASLSVVAVGEPPLYYQWRREGTDLPGATNASLIFSAVQETDAGVYSVFVSNHRGSTLSLPASLVVTHCTGGGVITIDTYTNNAPAYDMDGVTRLTGSNFIAQVYAGPSHEILRPVGAPVSFLPGGRAGYLMGVHRTLPDVRANETAYVQLRAWETARGASYEEARARGGKYGFSPVASVVTSGLKPIVRTQAFSLRAGLPFFFTGRLSVGERLPDGTQQYLLTGEPGLRYLVEKRLPPHNWVPLLTVTNVSGTVLFTDPEPQDGALGFYRARVLD